jgi:integrase
MPAFPQQNTQSTARERVLTPEELRKVMATLTTGIAHETRLGEVDMMAEAFRLMLYTGQRRGEVLSMEWAEVASEKSGVWWTMPIVEGIAKHKSGREHRVPLTAPAVDALTRLHTLTGKSLWVFPGPKAAAQLGHVSNPQKAAERLWFLSGLQGITVHDLRRTCASTMAALGITEYDIGKVLGHSAKSVTGARYNKYQYDKEKRAALNLWAAELERIRTEDKDEAAPTTAKLLPWTR